MTQHGDKRIHNGKRQVFSTLAGNCATTYIVHEPTGEEYSEHDAWIAPPRIKKDLVVKYREYGVWVDDI